jgi:putative transcriptional regulator
MMRLVLTILAAALATTGLVRANPVGAADPIDGQLLVATEHMPDPRFAGSVVLVVEHDDAGALGLVVNRPLGEVPFSEVLQGTDAPDVPPDASILVHYGGPVGPEQGFVIHSADYALDATKVVTDAVSVTSDPRILADMATGHGPERSLFVIGYAGWGPGQLEGEISHHDWITVPIDPDLLFDPDAESKWGRAMDLQGIDL